MAREIHIFPSADTATPRQLKWVTVGVVAWIATWAGLAAWVAVDVAQLERLSNEAIAISQPLGSVAAFLRGLSRVPFVGAPMSAAATDLTRVAASLRASGGSSRAGIEQLSLLLGISIAVIPVLPFVVLFVRMRQERRREAAALDRALADPARRMVAVRYLAGRAMTNLPYQELLECVRGGPSGAPDTAERLAAAELDRLGLSGARVRHRRPAPEREDRAS